MKKELLRIGDVTLGHRPIGMNLTIYEREILVVCGLSDSGIFALADLLSGQVPMTEGSLWLCEQPAHPRWLRNPTENWVFRFRQTHAVIDYLTVAENIFVFNGKKKNTPFVDYTEINFMAEEILKEFGLNISPTDLVGDLTDPQIHIIELIRAAYFGARLIILDDVFTSYSAKDRQFSFGIVKTLHEIGISFLIFSSEHEELSPLFDRLIIIREGETVKSISHKAYQKNTIYPYMLGGDLQPTQHPPQHPLDLEGATPIFSAEDVTCRHLNNLTFSIYPGEIFALLDTHDIHLHSLLDALLHGVPYRGAFYLNGSPITKHFRNPLAAMGLGVIDYTDNSSLFETLTWPENLALMYRNRMGRQVALSAKKSAKLLAAEYGYLLEGLSPDLPLNTIPVTPYQQTILKYLCWIVRKPSVLLCIRPHATTDVLMRQLVGEMLHLATTKGISILIATSSPKEALACASRIGILENGTLSCITSSQVFSP